ncbi:glycosyltransferase family 2 protein [Sutcliffiella halmapala]|uniref:glycosyltransferase family 2 protein n=1 Tax=Sutcliffiella halmapala TaxID=79882 RepID=UPI0009949E6C|nr:glycosyltransferase family 2 protein [Sutcliffiella halmapala]
MISVVLPTIGTREAEIKRLVESLEKQTYKNVELIVVTQDNHEKIQSILASTTLTYTHVPINKRGLSIARNVGMQYVKGDIVTFSDDDCWYPEDSFEFVNDYMMKKNEHITCFQIFDPTKKDYYKSYPDTPIPQTNWRKLFNKSSIEIFVNLSKVKREAIKFDEKFGLGATYPSGEENVFLFDLKKQGYRISYFPQIVVYHLKPDVSTRLTNAQIIGKGPMFKRIFNTPIALALVTLFLVKKFKHIEQPLSLLTASLKETLTYKKN